MRRVELSDAAAMAARIMNNLKRGRSPVETVRSKSKGYKSLRPNNSSIDVDTKVMVVP